MTESEAAVARPSGVDRNADLRDELAETQEQLAATSEILSLLGAVSRGQDEVFHAIVKRARQLCRADVAQIHIVHGDVYRLARSVGLSPELSALNNTNPIRRDRTSLIGRVSLDGSTQQIVDVLADPEYNRPDFQRLGGYRSILGAPMLVDDEVVGVLQVWRTAVDPFDERVSSLLSTFATQGALALRNVALFSALESRSAELARKVDQLEALSEVGEALNATLDPDEVLATIVSHAVELSGTDGGSLMEFDEQTSLFRVRTAYGTSPEVLDRLRRSRIDLHESFVGRSAESGKAAQISDLALVERDPHLEVLYSAGWRSLVAIPLTRPDRIVGALVVRRKQPSTFSDETCDLLSAFASQSAIALANARLYQELGRRGEELKVASQHKSEFLASMSHELRTPLNAVIGFSEVLLERMFGELNDRQADYLQDILGAGRHLLALLNDVLDLSKVEAGRMDLEMTSFDVSAALAYALSMVRERAAVHRIGVSLDLPAGSPGTVLADELRFKQILLNLLTNAVKFTPDGGSVTVVARRRDGELVVTVTDTGIGIAPEDQTRVFDSFQQGGRSAATTEGTGLGLTLTKRIVELHGGRMWLNSEPGKGSTFGFSLPQWTPSIESTPPWEADIPDGRPLVVVIEDDANSAELVALHLDAAGLRALHVRTGEEGLTVVHRLRPAAVVLDIRLPGIDGWEVLTALKASEDTADTPVIVVSVLPERGHGFALGATDYLVKPVGKHDLIAALRRIPIAHGPDGRRRIVVVDHDPAAPALIRQTLEPLGWTVDSCTEGSAAHELVLSTRPSVVLVDLLLPDLDGFTVIEGLGADPETAMIPLVVLTAKSLTATDRERLNGRIEFVAAKGDLDLERLARLLSGLARPGRGAAGASTTPAGSP